MLGDGKGTFREAGNISEQEGRSAEMLIPSRFALVGAELVGFFEKWNEERINFLEGLMQRSQQGYARMFGNAVYSVNPAGDVTGPGIIGGDTGTGDSEIDAIIKRFQEGSP